MVGPHGGSYLMVGAVVCALVAAGWDLARRRIPNLLTYSAAVLGLSAQLVVAGRKGLLDGLAGGLVAGGIFFALFALRAMGAGDVKLMAALGCWVGIRQGLLIVLASAIAGGLLAVIVMVARRRVGRTLRNIGELGRFYAGAGLKPHPQINLQNPESVAVPYAVAIAAGTLYCFGVLLLRR